jgi:hypothetical protein
MITTTTCLNCGLSCEETFCDDSCCDAFTAYLEGEVAKEDKADPKTEQ